MTEGTLKPNKKNECGLVGPQAKVTRAALGIGNLAGAIVPQV